MASGDLIYGSEVSLTLTGTQKTALATFISTLGLAFANSSINHIVIDRTDRTNNIVIARVSGELSAASASLPLGVTVIDRVP